MRCPQCHAKISEDAKFCPFCGERLTIYQASQEKYEMENDQQYYYDREAQKALDEAMEREMIAPLTAEKRKKKKNVIIISLLVIVGVIGGIYFLKHTFNDNDSTLPLFNVINKQEETVATASTFIPAAYQEEGMSLLEQMTSQTMNERALAVGGQAFVAEVSNYANELDVFYQKATTADEREFARTVENVSLLSLSIMGEQASVAEQGGRNDAQAEATLEQRITQVNDWKKRLQEATTSEEIIAINKEIEEI